ncbi:MAG: B12-binding domain-containing radical SAM protein [Chloroflexi bacterium]|nr:B12-binding domain-containing radical SAM protein [Chloroflexota bacterium]
MKILLINPPLLIDESRYLPRRPSYPFEHLGLGYLASFLRMHGHEVTVKDAYLDGLDADQFFPLISSVPADLIGFSATHGFMTSAVSLVQRLRKSGFDGHITFGGYLPTFLPEDLLRDFPEIDSIVRGEGEFTLLELVEKLDKPSSWDTIGNLTYRDRDGNIKSNPPRPLIEDLDALPFPARDTLPQLMTMQDYGSICSSRGCYGKCTFCSIHSFYGKSPGSHWRGRSAKSVVDEMEKLAAEWKIEKFAFPDDNFLGTGRKGNARAMDVAKEILRRGITARYSILCRASDVDNALFAFLKASGMGTVFVGFESGVDRALQTFGKMSDSTTNREAAKKLKGLGIKCYPGFIMFDPYTTLDEVEENLEFASLLEADGDLIEIDDLFNSLQIFVGTPIHDRLSREGRLFPTPTSLLPYDVLPTYHVADERVERLREQARDFRKIIPRVHYINYERLARELPEEDFTELQKQFRSLTHLISIHEEKFLSEGVRHFKTQTLGAAEKSVITLKENLASELEPAIKSYDDKVEEFLSRDEKLDRYIIRG